MRTLAALVSSVVLLLSMAGEAAAAAQWAPRMERVASCSWDRPGHNPFMGDVVASIDRYTDIPTLVRVRLKQRMQIRDYDDLVTIRRDEISGRRDYLPNIRDMHFGLDRVCRQVTRERWTAKMQERGLVYCEDGHCILVPTVCRNVSRIEPRPAELAVVAQVDRFDAALKVEAPSAVQTNVAPTQPPGTSTSSGEVAAGTSEPLPNGATLAGPGQAGGAGFGSGGNASASDFNFSGGNAVTAPRTLASSLPLAPPHPMMAWYNTLIYKVVSTVNAAANLVKPPAPPSFSCR